MGRWKIQRFGKLRTVGDKEPYTNLRLGPRTVAFRNEREGEGGTGQASESVRYDGSQSVEYENLGGTAGE